MKILRTTETSNLEQLMKKKNINWFHDLITKQGNNGSQKI